MTPRRDLIDRLHRRYDGPPPDIARAVARAGGAERYLRLRGESRRMFFDGLAKRAVAGLARRRAAIGADAERLAIDPCLGALAKDLSFYRREAVVTWRPGPRRRSLF